MRTIRAKRGIEALKDYFGSYLENEYPYFNAGCQLWGDRRMKNRVQPLLEKTVKERYNATRDCEI